MTIRSNSSDRFTLFGENRLSRSCLLTCLLLAALLSTNMAPSFAQNAQNSNQNQNQSKSNPDYLDILYKGRDFYGRGDLQNALAQFKEFARLKPNNLAVHFWLCTVYSEMGMNKQALDAYSSSLKLAASVGMDSPELRINLGNCMCLEGYVKESLFDYERSLVIDKRYALAYLGMAKCRIETGDYDGALTALGEYQRAGGSDTSAILLRGLALAAKEQLVEARYCLNLYLQQNNANFAAATSATMGATNATNQNESPSVKLARQVLETISAPTPGQ